MRVSLCPSFFDDSVVSAECCSEALLLFVRLCCDLAKDENLDAVILDPNFAHLCGQSEPVHGLHFEKYVDEMRKELMCAGLLTRGANGFEGLVLTDLAKLYVMPHRP